MSDTILYEFDRILDDRAGKSSRAVPAHVFAWLEAQCLREDVGHTGWLKLTREGGRRAIAVTGFVGVLQAPCGHRIEILPKIGKDSGADEARAVLICMIKCLSGFRHIKIGKAGLLAVKMPLLEVFIKEFLHAVAELARRGLRSDYIEHKENLDTLRGKLLVARHLSSNLLRPDRFFTEHDEYAQDRAENRLIHAALRSCLALCRSQENQHLARELCAKFAGIPTSVNVNADLLKIRLTRGMTYYEASLHWAKVILQGLSPSASSGRLDSISIMFPMEALFEAYVARSLALQLCPGHALELQPKRHHLVAHGGERWFRLKPDMTIKRGGHIRLVLDTKWKRLDASKKNGRDKYQLAQSDFYQLYAYGHHYADGAGDLVLVYPRTERFKWPLAMFGFPKSNDLRLWVLPFCLRARKILLPATGELDDVLLPAAIAMDASGGGTEPA